MDNTIRGLQQGRSLFPSRLYAEKLPGDSASPPMEIEDTFVQQSAGDSEKAAAVKCENAGENAPATTLFGKFTALCLSALAFGGALFGASPTAAKAIPPHQERAQERILKTDLSGLCDAEQEGAGNTAEIDQLKTNPSSQEIRKLLDAAAKKHKVPNEIVYAVAWHESGWKHFEDDGTVVQNENLNKKGRVVSTDWGIMQINDHAHPGAFPNARTDIQYNIDYGVKLLRSLYRETGSWQKAVKRYNGSQKYLRTINRVMARKPWPGGRVKSTGPRVIRKSSSPPAAHAPRL